MPVLSRSRLLYVIACCMMIGLLVVSLAYVLSPREANLNVSFEPPGGYVGEDGRYVDVTVVTLTNEDTTPIRGIEVLVSLLRPGERPGREERQHRGRGSRPGAVEALYDVVPD